MAGALNTAINIVNAALDREYLPAIKGKAPTRFEAYTVMVQEEANRLYSVIANTPDSHDELMMVGSPEDVGFSDLEEVELDDTEGDEWS